MTMALTDQQLGLNGNGFHVFPATKVNTTVTEDVFAFSAPLKMMLHPKATFYFSGRPSAIAQRPFYRVGHRPIDLG